ncbi:MAG: hypothetical protein ITG02_02770 [Patulibacter sp.]|nr:hypothetical protein [Patulibacter sp.]
MATKTDNKRVLFYDVETFDNGSQNQQSVDIVPFFQAVAALPAVALSKKKPTRYLEWKDNELLMEVFSSSADQIKGGFAIKRLSGLPRLESAGNWSDVVLQAGQGLAEIRHFIYWPKHKVIGIEVNGNGPGMGALAAYIKGKAPKGAIGLVEFSIYLAADQFDVLQASTRVSSATIGVRRDSLDEISKLDQDLHDGLESLAKSSNAHELRVELKLGTRKKGASLDVGFAGKLKAFIGNAKQRESLTTLKAYASDEGLGEMRTIDLLEDRFVGREAVVVNNDGVVDRASMLKAIETASSAVI